MITIGGDLPIIINLGQIGMLMEINNTMAGYLKTQNRSMKSLRALLSCTENPVFLLSTGGNDILAANDAAILACGDGDLAGKQLREFVHIEKITNQPAGEFAFLNNKWRIPEYRNITFNKKLYTKLVLKQSPSIPDKGTLLTIRNMIAVLVHRLRSPMTGMQGYLEMIQDIENENDKRKLTKVSEGLDHLFEIMNELELFHHTEAYLKDEPNTTASDAEALIREMLIEYPEELRNRVQVVNHADGNFEFNASELRQIITLLLNNSAGHPSAAGKPIKIEIQSDRKLTVTNFGSPIPEEIVENLFFPFVTTKANNLGIGLSLAQLIAGRRGAAIVLSENSSTLGISFTLLCKPNDFSS